MMNLVVLAVLFATFTTYSDAAALACHEITDENACLDHESCAWREDPDDDLDETSCYCNSKKPLDVMFIMDESGSMKKDPFNLQKQFVIDMIQQGLAPDSNVHVAKFSTDVSPVWNFNDDQSNNWEEATDAINDTTWDGGQTHMAEALEYVQKVFNDEWSGSNDRLLVFLTDGVPSSDLHDPCPEVEATQNLVGDENIVVIGMGKDWTEQSINCMVTPGYSHSAGANNADPDDGRIFNVKVFNKTAFDAVLGAISDILCPISMDLKLTEMSIESFSNGADTYHSRFVEFYNPGDPLDFSLGVTNLEFKGFLSSDVFGPDSEQQCDVFVDEGQYVVIYDPNTADLPECLDCDCTLNGNTLQCDDAVYIPCDSNPSTSGCGVCDWNDAMSNDEWYQAVYDKASNELLNYVIRDGADGWTDVRSGYTTELIAKTRDSSLPSNWEQSCTERGTPGADPFSPCLTTKAPTRDPTAKPTTYPTSYPTATPSTNPSSSPTMKPTKWPTAKPTELPTTPAPTHPGALCCGSRSVGDYNGEPMEVEVRMHFEGDMTLDMSHSDFEVGRIEVFDSDDDIVGTCESSKCSLFDLDHGTDYFFKIEGAEGVAKGTFDIRIECTSDAPTRSPSTEPTPSPTTRPTSEPSSSPTMKPSADPSSSPTMKPTGHPSPAPTTQPTMAPSTGEPTPFPSMTAPPVTPAPQPRSGDPQCAPNGDLSPSGQVCCPMDLCNQCGGAGCSKLTTNIGGTYNCCAEKIIDNEDLCDGNNFAPCVMYFDDPTCEEGFENPNNEVCCPEGLCTQCGGAGCSNLENNPGGTADCCAGSIIESDIWCDEHAAPCILPSYRDTVSFLPFMWVAGVYTGIVRGEWTLWDYEIAGVVLVMSLSICVLCCALCSKQSVIRRKPKYVKVRLDSTTDDEAVDLM